MVHYVTPTTPARQARWLAIFGVEFLPVLAARPRLQETRHGAVMAYDLDVARIHPFALIRLASRLARETYTDFDDLYAQIVDGFPLQAEGLIAISKPKETAVSTPPARKRPFLGAYELQPLGRQHACRPSVEIGGRA